MDKAARQARADFLEAMGAVEDLAGHLAAMPADSAGAPVASEAEVLAEEAAVVVVVETSTTSIPASRTAPSPGAATIQRSTLSPLPCWLNSRSSRPTEPINSRSHS